MEKVANHILGLLIVVLLIYAWPVEDKKLVQSEDYSVEETSATDDSLDEDSTKVDRPASIWENVDITYHGTRKAVNSIDRILEIAKSDPWVFGSLGHIRHFLQETTDSLDPNYAVVEISELFLRFSLDKVLDSDPNEFVDYLMSGSASEVTNKLIYLREDLVTKANDVVKSNKLSGYYAPIPHIPPLNPNGTMNMDRLKDGEIYINPKNLMQYKWAAKAKEWVKVK